MREIKFRVWEKPPNEFKGKLWTDNDPKFWASCLMNEKDEYELSQYTGFKYYDTEVFEGDIVQDEEGDMFCVVWDNDRFSFRADLIGEKGYGLYDDFELKDVLTVNAVGVLGNIYENPDLLTQKP